MSTRTPAPSRPASHVRSALCWPTADIFPSSIPDTFNDLVLAFLSTLPEE